MTLDLLQAADRLESLCNTNPWDKPLAALLRQMGADDYAANDAQWNRAVAVARAILSNAVSVRVAEVTYQKGDMPKPSTGTGVRWNDYHDRAPVRYCGAQGCHGVLNSDDPDDWCCHARGRRKQRQSDEESK